VTPTVRGFAFGWRTWETHRVLWRESDTETIEMRPGTAGDGVHRMMFDTLKSRAALLQRMQQWTDQMFSIESYRQTVGLRLNTDLPDDTIKTLERL